jgi:hypothetical protein
MTQILLQKGKKIYGRSEINIKYEEGYPHYRRFIWLR